MSQFDLRAEGKKFELYQYTPTLVGAIIFAILFLVSTAYHGFQIFQKRAFFFIPLFIGGVFEVIGYVGRALGHNNKTSLSLYIMQTITLLVAPALFAASIYMTLGRTIRFTNGESMSPIRANWLTKIFVCGDIFSFLVQVGGGGMMSDASRIKLGKNLILIGLFLQIVFFGLFLICGGLFHFRLARNPTPASSTASWKKYMYVLYGTGIIILIRSLFRVAEFGAGRDSTLQTHEAWLYIFDAVLMFLVMVIFNIVHPGSMLGRAAQREGIPLSGRGDYSSTEQGYGRK